jgi:hypothetical protein
MQAAIRNPLCAGIVSTLVASLSVHGPLRRQRRYSRPADRSTGVIFDQTPVLQGYQSAKDYPETFRGIRYKDPDTGKRLLFISNNTALPALSICSLYKARWAGRALFSSDQNAFARKGILRNLGKCSKVANLDRSVGLRARHHHQKAPQFLSQPVRNATDLESQLVRENPFGYSVFAYPDGLRISSRQQLFS